MDEILQRDHSNEIVLVLFIMPYKMVLTFELVDDIPESKNSVESC